MPKAAGKFLLFYPECPKRSYVLFTGSAKAAVQFLLFFSECPKRQVTLFTRKCQSGNCYCFTGVAQKAASYFLLWKGQVASYFFGNAIACTLLLLLLLLLPNPLRCNAQVDFRFSLPDRGVMIQELLMLCLRLRCHYAMF